MALWPCASSPKPISASLGLPTIRSRAMSAILTDFSHSLSSCSRERVVLRRIVVLAFLAILLRPLERLLVFGRVENALVHAAEKFRHVNRLDPHAEITLKKRLVHNGAGDAHRDAAHAEIGFAAHHRHRQTGAGETEDFLLHVGGDRSCRRRPARRGRKCRKPANPFASGPPAPPPDKPRRAAPCR